MFQHRPQPFLVLALLLAAPLAAQESAAPWRLSYFPYVTVSPNDGLMGIARAIWFRQAEWGDRVTLNNSVAVEAGYSTKDAWLGRITWANPRIADGWRVVGHAEARSNPRFGDPDNPTEREYAGAWLDVTRRVRGPLMVAVRGAYAHDQVSGPRDRVRRRYRGVILDDDPPNPPVTDPIPVSITRDEANARFALVLDLRDREYEVNNGVLLEGGVTLGGGDFGYTQPYAHARAWASPLPYLRLTARAGILPVVEGLQSLAARHTMPAWEQPFEVLGGPYSHRGLGIGEFTDKGLTFAGAEARFDVMNLGELGAITLLAFADGGRRDIGNTLSTGCEFDCVQYQSDNWQWAAGGGIALRVLRTAVLNVTAARGGGETRWYVSSGWSW